MPGSRGSRLCVIARSAATKQSLKSIIASLRGAQRRSNPFIMATNKQYYVYIITNKNNTVLYTGITGNLIQRIYQHREKMLSGFSKKYNLYKLVYYEIFEDSYNAIVREKQIKGGSRKKKVELINGMNPLWKDLFSGL